MGYKMSIMDVTIDAIIWLTGNKKPAFGCFCFGLFCGLVLATVFG